MVNFPGLTNQQLYCFLGTVMVGYWYLRNLEGTRMDAETVITALDTLTVGDLRRVLARAQELDELYRRWGHQEENTKGTYVQEWVKCGKRGCKSCSELGGHGPYWYFYWWEAGEEGKPAKKRKKYIGKNKPEGV